MGNGHEGDEKGGGTKLSRRCYQVKPPTTGCRHGDTMVTARCSTRKEHDLAYVKGLFLCVTSSLYLSHSVSFSGIICPKRVYVHMFIYKDSQQI